MTDKCPECGRKNKIGDRPIPDSDWLEFWVYLAQIESQLESLEAALAQTPANKDKLRWWFAAIQARCDEALLMLSSEAPIDE